MNTFISQIYLLSKIHDRPSQQEVVPWAGGQEGTSLFANRDEGGRLVPPPCATREVGLREEVSLRPFARKPIQLCRKAGELFSHQEMRTAEPHPGPPRPICHFCPGVSHRAATAASDRLLLALKPDGACHHP